MQDDRSYYTFYGINTNDFSYNFGNQSNQHNLLVENYISEDASTVSAVAWSSGGTVFLYPHHIKKKYYLEGVVAGHLTFTSDPVQNRSFVSDYKVSVIKIHTDATETILAATSVVSIGKRLNVTGNAGEYCVLPFWIDVFTSPKEISENERVGIKVEWDVNNTSSTTAFLSVDNWQQGEDLKITFPFVL